MQRLDLTITRRQALQRAAGGAAALTLPGLLTACGSSGGSGGSEAILRVGRTAEDIRPNPFSEAWDRSFVVLLPGLTQLNPRTNRFEAGRGAFAERMEVSRDGREFRFGLRAGHRWSDGRPATSADVVFTYETVQRYADGVTASDAEVVDGLRSITAEDERTVVLRFASGSALRPRSLTMRISPRHVFEPLAAGDGKRLERFDPGADLPCSGPVMLRSFAERESVLLVPNPGWPGTPTRLDGLGVRFFSNAEAMLTALRSGEIDVIDSTYPSEALDALDDDRFEVLQRPGNTFTYLTINSNPRKPRHRELLRPDVREAIEHAIDRDKIVRVAFDGGAEAAAAWVPASYPGFHATGVGGLPFDVGRANALLDAAGLRRGGDGVRVADDGPMDYQLLTPTEEPYTDRQFGVIREGLEAAGIRVRQKSLNEDALFEAITAPDGKTLESDMHVWSNGVGQDPQVLAEMVDARLVGDLNEAAYLDPECSRLARRQASILDPRERQAAFVRIQELVARDRPYLPLVTIPTTAVVSRAWTGFAVAREEYLGATATFESLTTIRRA